jgi:hypothetical protein
MARALVAIAKAVIAGRVCPERVTIEWPEALCLCSAGIRRDGTSLAPSWTKPGNDRVQAFRKPLDPGGSVSPMSALGKNIEQQRAKGLEPSTSSLGIGERLVLSVGSTALTTSDLGGCTRCCTSGVLPIAVPPQPAAHGLPENPELVAVIQAWDHLPPAVRAGVVAMVRASGG